MTKSSKIGCAVYGFNLTFAGFMACFDRMALSERF